MIEDTLASMVERFNRHVQKNPGVLQELKDKARTIEVCFTDDATFRILLKDGQLSMPTREDGGKVDVKITTDTDTFEGLIRKDIGPMKALFTKKLVINATLEDKLLMRRLL